MQRLCKKIANNCTILVQSLEVQSCFSRYLICRHHWVLSWHCDMIMNMDVNIATLNHNGKKFNNVITNSNGNMNGNHIGATLNNCNFPKTSTRNNSSNNNNNVNGNKNATLINWIDIGCLKTCGTSSFRYNSSQRQILNSFASYLLNL